MAKKGKGLRKKIKKIGRARAKIQKKVIKVAAPVLTAAATIIAGPAGGLVVGAATAQAGRRIGATAARAEGKRGREARKEGVKLRKKLLKLNALGLVGGIGIGAVAAGGLSATGLLGAGSSAASTASTFIKPKTASVPGEANPVIEDRYMADVNASEQGGILNSLGGIGDTLLKAGTQYLGGKISPAPNTAPVDVDLGGSAPQERGAGLIERLQNFASENPMLAAGAALAGGVIIFMMARRK